MSRAYLGIGSNLGDSESNIRKAVELLGEAECVGEVALSPLYRSAPVGNVEQGWFVNGVVRLETSCTPHDLLEICLDVEKRLGRVRDERWGPRTLDLDILFIDDMEIAEAGLQVPHPRIAERAFVLRPLWDLDPDRKIEGKPIGILLAECFGQKISRIEPVGQDVDDQGGFDSY